jgi:regulator of protease activity HflC (stomatin/prohibitin superfamily)
MLLIIVIAISIWLSTIFVINSSKDVIVIEDKFSLKVKFKKDSFFLKLPYPLQTVEQRISLEKQSVERYLHIGGIDFDFSCVYQIIDPHLAYFKLHDFEDYLLELISNILIQSIEKDIVDKETHLKDKLTGTLGRYGILVISLTFKH